MKKPGIGGRVTLQWRNLTNTTSVRWSKSTATIVDSVGNMFPQYDMMKMALYLSDLPPKASQSPYSYEKKTSEKLQQK